MRGLRALLAALLFLPISALARPSNLTGVYTGRPAASAPAQTSTWDKASSDTACGTPCFTFSTTNVANDTALFSTGAGTVISTFNFTSNQSGSWYYEEKIVGEVATGTDSLQFGHSSSATNTYIGNGGNNASMQPNGVFRASGWTAPTTQSGISWAAGTVVGIYVTLNSTTGHVWWTTDNVTFYGDGGSTTRTASEVIAGTGGWVMAFDNRQRFPAFSTYGGAGNQVQLLGGTNITRTPLAGFTVIP